MGKIITIASQKGGVGKTTTALNLGYSLSTLSRKILIIDGDPQGGTAGLCNLKSKTAKGLIHALQHAIAPQEIAIPLYNNYFSIAGAGIEQPDDTLLFEESAKSGALGQLIKTISEDYDYIILDAPVGVGVIVKALFEVSDSYIIAINCKAGTVKSLPKLMKLADWLIKNVNPQLDLEGVVVNMFDESSSSETKIFNHFKSRLPESFFFKTIIPYGDFFETASMRSVPVALLSGCEQIANQYNELAAELLNGTDGQTEHQSDSNQMNSLLEDTPFDLVYEDQPGSPSAEDSGGNVPQDILSSTLQSMCRAGNYHGAVVADEMGFPLAEYHSPIHADMLAAYTSVLGDSLEKAGSILELPEANNITLDINENDKFVMRRFDVLNSTYYLLVVCPQEATVHGEIELAVSQISAGLS